MTDRQATFERIKRSEAFAHRQSRQLSRTGTSSMGKGCLVFLVVCCLVTLGGMVWFLFRILTLIGDERHQLSPVDFFPVAFLLLIAILYTAWMVTSFRKSVRYMNAPLRPEPALVISKHSRARGKHLSNHITLEFEDGRREEFRVGSEKEAALVGVGDAGVAYLKLDLFLAFDRVV